MIGQRIHLVLNWQEKKSGKKAEAQQGEYNETPLDADGITVY